MCQPNETPCLNVARGRRRFTIQDTEPKTFGLSTPRKHEIGDLTHPPVRLHCRPNSPCSHFRFQTKHIVDALGIADRGKYPHTKVPVQIVSLKETRVSGFDILL